VGENKKSHLDKFQEILEQQYNNAIKDVNNYIDKKQLRAYFHKWFENKYGSWSKTDLHRFACEYAILQ
jgi:hypothetical protein